MLRSDVSVNQQFLVPASKIWESASFLCLNIAGNMKTFWQCYVDFYKTPQNIRFWETVKLIYLSGLYLWSSLMLNVNVIMLGNIITSPLLFYDFIEPGRLMTMYWMTMWKESSVGINKQRKQPKFAAQLILSELFWFSPLIVCLSSKNFTFYSLSLCSRLVFRHSKHHNSGEKLQKAILLNSTEQSGSFSK